MVNEILTKSQTKVLTYYTFLIFSVLFFKYFIKVSVRPFKYYLDKVQGLFIFSIASRKRWVKQEKKFKGLKRQIKHRSLSRYIFKLRKSPYFVIKSQATEGTSIEDVDIFQGEGVKILPNLLTESSIKLPTEGGW